MEHLQLHASQKIAATAAGSALCVGMEPLSSALVVQAAACLGVVRPFSQAESWTAALWQTFTISVDFPVH